MNFHFNRKPSLLSLLFLIFLVLMGQAVGQFVGTIFTYILLGVNSRELQMILLEPTDHPLSKNAILLYQGIIILFSFIIAPLIFIYKWEGQFLSSRLLSSRNSLLTWAVALSVVVAL